MTHFFEPIIGPGWERRDELGNTAPYRSQPHRGSDWGYKNGSEGKAIFAIHGGQVTKVYNDPALGWTVITKLVCDDSCGYNGEHIEYNHMLEKPTLKVGDALLARRSQIGKIGATGSSLSQSGAFHLHASMAPSDVPHNADRKTLRDLFKLIDASTAQRRKISEAKKAAESASK